VKRQTDFLSLFTHSIDKDGMEQEEEEEEEEACYKNL
jgi:hypothetical protein